MVNHCVIVVSCSEADCFLVDPCTSIHVGSLSLPYIICMAGKYPLLRDNIPPRAKDTTQTCSAVK